MHYTRGEALAALANHKSEPEANARYLFDEDRNVHTVIYSGEEIVCDYGTKYQLEGDLAGKHDTLAGQRHHLNDIGSTYFQINN